MWDKKTFWDNLLNLIVYNIYSLYPHELFLSFFIKNIKTLIFFFNFPDLTRVNPSNPEPDPLAGLTPMSGLITMVVMKIYFLICYIF
jgi:hypothetical protein